MREEIRDFLNTGLLEQYVLGLTDMSETRTTEQFIQKHPEVRKIYEDLQIGMERLAKASAIPAPLDVKENLMRSIDDDISDDAPFRSQPSIWLPIAASLAILLGAFSFFQMNSLNTKKQEIATLNEEFAAYKEECENQNLKLAEIQSQFEFINAPETKKYFLNGNDKATNFQTVAYWNDAQKKSMLQILDLPDLPEKRCYQMWADVDGKMLNLGVLKKGVSDMPIDWKYLANAESLNVTIEPEGGSEHPTVADLVASISI